MTQQAIYIITKGIFPMRSKIAKGNVRPLLLDISFDVLAFKVPIQIMLINHMEQIH